MKLCLDLLGHQLGNNTGAPVAVLPNLRAAEAERSPARDLQIAATAIAARDLNLCLFMMIVSVAFNNDPDFFIGDNVDEDREVDAVLANLVLWGNHNITQRLGGIRRRVPNLYEFLFWPVRGPDEGCQQNLLDGTAAQNSPRE